MGASPGKPRRNPLLGAAVLKALLQRRSGEGLKQTTTLYEGVLRDQAVAQAHILTPNAFELEFLTGRAADTTVSALAAIPFFGGEFLPELKEGHFILHMSAVPGTALRETMRIGKPAGRQMMFDA